MRACVERAIEKRVLRQRELARRARVSAATLLVLWPHDARGDAGASVPKDADLGNWASAPPLFLEMVVEPPYVLGSWRSEATDGSISAQERARANGVDVSLSGTRALVGGATPSAPSVACGGMGDAAAKTVRDAS